MKTVCQCLLGLLLGGFLAGLIGCNKVKPSRPVISRFDDSLTVGPSYLSAPVVFELADLEAKINRSLGTVLVGEENLNTSGKKPLNLRVERTGPVRIGFDGRHLTFGAPLTVWISNPLSLRRKNIPRQALCKLTVRFQSPINVDRNWRLRTRVELANYQWIEAPKIRLLGINFPVRKIVEKVLRKRENGIESAIDKMVYEQLKLNREVGKIWRDLQKPILINRKHEFVWLVPSLQDVLVGRIGGNTTQLTIPIRIRLRVNTVIGEKPEIAHYKPLPPLQKTDTLTMVSQLNVLSRVPYLYLNDVLNRTVVGRQLSPTKHLVRLEKAEIYGGGNSLILQTSIRGTINGTLYFRGQPAFDTVRQVLMVRQVDFDVDTEEILLRTADWLLHDTLKDSLQAALTVPLRQQMDSLPVKIEQAFSRGRAGRKARLHLGEFRLVPTQIAIRPESIHVLLRLDARVALRVTRL